MNLTKEESLIALQWFEARLSNEPDLVLQKDYKLAIKLYINCGLPVSALVRHNADI